MSSLFQNDSSQTLAARFTLYREALFRYVRSRALEPTSESLLADLHTALADLEVVLQGEEGNILFIQDLTGSIWVLDYTNQKRVSTIRASSILGSTYRATFQFPNIYSVHDLVINP